MAITDWPAAERPRERLLEQGPHVLSDAELSTFAGTSVARDFVESPSQMLEEWAWAKETLDLFAVHHETKKPLPRPLYAGMLRSRGFGRP